MKVFLQVTDAGLEVNNPLCFVHLNQDGGYNVWPRGNLVQDLNFFEIAAVVLELFLNHQHIIGYFFVVAEFYGSGLTTLLYISQIN